MSSYDVNVVRNGICLRIFSHYDTKEFSDIPIRKRQARVHSYGFTTDRKI